MLLLPSSSSSKQARQQSLSLSLFSHLFLLLSSSSKHKPPKNHSVDSRRIDNPTLRSLFDGAVDLGADAAGRATKLWDTLAK